MNTPAVLQGITKLLACARGTLSILVLGAATTAVLLGKIEGTAYAAIIGTVHAIYTFTQHRVEIAAGAADDPDDTSSQQAPPPALAQK